MKKVLILLLLVTCSIKASFNSDESEEIQVSRENEVDVKKKTNECRQLVENGVRHFQKVSIENACKDFLYNPIWRKGELFLYVLNKDGICMAHGDDSDLIWQPKFQTKYIGEGTLISEMLTFKKGDFIGYFWNNAYKTSFVQSVTKNGKEFILGTGFFPEDDEYISQELVKLAVKYFNQRGKDEAFAAINTPGGPFTKGDISVFVDDFDGVAIVNDNPALVGQNLIDQVDSQGKPIVKSEIALAKTKGKGWVAYYWKNNLKKSYIEKVVDPKTKKAYVIGAGYYPYVTLKTVQTFVNRAISYLKAHGAREAFAEFSNPIGEFIKGGLAIFVYDLKGKALADGYNPAFVGQNIIKRVDQDGKYFVKNKIDLAKTRGKGILTYRIKNAYAVAYVEKVDIPDGKFVIGSRFFPTSKVSSTQVLVEKAVEFFKKNPKEVSFAKFSSKDTDFYRGDLFIFVYDTKGTRLVNGIHKNQIWKNFIKTTDQEGAPVISDIIATALNGGGWVEYKTRNDRRRVYVQAVTKQEGQGAEPETFVIGSGYFL